MFFFFLFFLFTFTVGHKLRRGKSCRMSGWPTTNCGDNGEIGNELLARGVRTESVTMVVCTQRRRPILTMGSALYAQPQPKFHFISYFICSWLWLRKYWRLTLTHLIAGSPSPPCIDWAPISVTYRTMAKSSVWMMCTVGDKKEISHSIFAFRFDTDRSIDRFGHTIWPSASVCERYRTT